MLMDNLNINSPIKITALGGLDEMGKNCYVIDVEGEIYIIEAGVKYPNRFNTGVDLIIPDFSYLEAVQEKIKAIIITHGHDDQYGSLPFLVKFTNVPIYATKTTVAIIKASLRNDYPDVDSYNFRIVQPSSSIVIGTNVFELFQTTHSVSESFGFALKTRFGNIIYTGDFMTDYAPLDGYKFDLPKLAKIVETDKTFLLMCESEGASTPGIASPSHKIEPYLRDTLRDNSGKLFVSLYTQDLYNITEVINFAIKYHKRILIGNPDDLPFFNELEKEGVLVIPRENKTDIFNFTSLNPSDVIVLLTGNGEKLFNYIIKITNNEVRDIKITSKDTFINAAPSVPATEKLATNANDSIYKNDCRVIYLDRKIFASMHPRQEDIKFLIYLLRPRYYFPIKGEFRLLMDNAKLAIDLNIGLNHFNCFVYDNGLTLQFDERGNIIKQSSTIKTGDVLIDNKTVGDINEDAINERSKMADGGVIFVTCEVSTKRREIVSDFDIQSRGFIYLKETEPLYGQIINVARSEINQNFISYGSSIEELEEVLSSKIEKVILKQTDKRPYTIVKLIDVDSFSKD